MSIVGLGLGLTPADSMLSNRDVKKLKKNGASKPAIRTMVHIKTKMGHFQEKTAAKFAKSKDIAQQLAEMGDGSVLTAVWRGLFTHYNNVNNYNEVHKKAVLREVFLAWDIAGPLLATTKEEKIQVLKNKIKTGKTKANTAHNQRIVRRAEDNLAELESNEGTAA